VSFQASEHSP